LAHLFFHQKKKQHKFIIVPPFVSLNSHLTIPLSRGSLRISHQHCSAHSPKLMSLFLKINVKFFLFLKIFVKK